MHLAALVIGDVGVLEQHMHALTTMLTKETDDRQVASLYQWHDQHSSALMTMRNDVNALLTRLTLDSCPESHGKEPETLPINIQQPGENELLICSDEVEDNVGKKVAVTLPIPNTEIALNEMVPIPKQFPWRNPAAVNMFHYCKPLLLDCLERIPDDHPVSNRHSESHLFWNEDVPA